MIDTTTISIAGLVVVVLLVGAAIATRFRVAKPSEAFIITGRKSKSEVDGTSGPKVVLTGGVFVVPMVQSLTRVPLSVRQIPLEVSGAPSAQGVMLDLIANAQVKIGGDEQSIRAAAQRFPDRTLEALQAFTTETLEGSLRGIAGTLTVEQIIQDRRALADKVAEAAEDTLTGQGLVLDSFTIKEVKDVAGSTYIRDLGRPQAAAVKRDADIAEAVARQTAEEARVAAEEKIAVAERTLALRQAEILKETDAANARAAASGPLAKAAADQEVLAQQALVAEAQAAVKERQLEVDVRKPADAERYRIEVEAEARRNATISDAEGAKTAQIARAEADRRSRELAAEAGAIEGAKKGEAEKALRVALAEALRTEGEAQAASELAVGSAKAEAMTKQAEAYKEYGEAAIAEMLVKVLPDIARELAAPMSNIDQLTVVSTDGAGALPKAVTGNLVQVLEMVKSTTGLDLQALIPAQGATAPALEKAPADA